MRHKRVRGLGNLVKENDIILFCNDRVKCQEGFLKEYNFFAKLNFRSMISVIGRVKVNFGSLNNN